MPPRSYDWVALRDEWVATNLALPVPGALSFKEFARDKDLNYEHLRSWASRDRWKDRLTAALGGPAPSHCARLMAGYEVCRCLSTRVDVYG